MKLKPPKETFNKWMDDNWEQYNILPPPLPAQTALTFLEKYLLGEDWYIVMPLTNDQANVEVVDAILRKYSKTYRKECKKRLKEHRRKMKHGN